MKTDEFEEGGTMFYKNDTFCEKDIYLKPKIGDAIIFRQRGFFHSGTSVASGLKYILLTSLMYGKPKDMKAPLPSVFKYKEKLGKGIVKVSELY